MGQPSAESERLRSDWAEAIEASASAACRGWSIRRAAVQGNAVIAGTSPSSPFARPPALQECITELQHLNETARNQQAHDLPATSASHSAYKLIRLCWFCALPFDPSTTHMRWAPQRDRPRRTAPGAGLGGRRASPAHSVLTLSAGSDCRLPDPFGSRRPRPPRPDRRTAHVFVPGAPRTCLCPGPAVGRRPGGGAGRLRGPSAQLAAKPLTIACATTQPDGRRRINTVRRRRHKAARLSRGSPGAARAAVRAVGAGRASERARSSVGRAEPRRHYADGGRPAGRPAAHRIHPARPDPPARHRAACGFASLRRNIGSSQMPSGRNR